MDDQFGSLTVRLPLNAWKLLCCSLKKAGESIFESQVIKRPDWKVFVPLAQDHLVTKPWDLSPPVSDPWKVLVCNYTKYN